MEGPVVIKEITSRNLGDVVSFQQRVVGSGGYSSQETLAQLSERIQSNGCIYLIAVMSELTIIGVCHGQTYTDDTTSFCLTGMAVEPSMKRRGIGRSLLSKMEERVIARGLWKTITLAASEEGEPFLVSISPWDFNPSSCSLSTWVGKWRASLCNTWTTRGDAPQKAALRERRGVSRVRFIFSKGASRLPADVLRLVAAHCDAFSEAAVRGLLSSPAPHLGLRGAPPVLPQGSPGAALSGHLASRVSPGPERTRLMASLRLLRSVRQRSSVKGFRQLCSLLLPCFSQVVQPVSLSVLPIGSSDTPEPLLASARLDACFGARRGSPPHLQTDYPIYAKGSFSGVLQISPPVNDANKITFKGDQRWCRFDCGIGSVSVARNPRFIFTLSREQFVKMMARLRFTLDSEELSLPEHIETLLRDFNAARKGNSQAARKQFANSHALPKSMRDVLLRSVGDADISQDISHLIDQLSRIFQNRLCTFFGTLYGFN